MPNIGRPTTHLVRYTHPRLLSLNTGSIFAKKMKMNNPTSGNKLLELFFTFKVKEGKQEQLEKILEQLIATTMEHDPGTLIFNVYKNSDGTWCMYERYVDEEAFARHKEIAGQTLTAWFEVVEIQKFYVLGAISDEASKNFKAAGYEVFKPVYKMER